MTVIAVIELATRYVDIYLLSDQVHATRLYIRTQSVYQTEAIYQNSLPIKNTRIIPIKNFEKNI